ncbi:MAG: hypothetical protein ACXVEF_10440 [Polyangiales bacterium]
MSSKAIARSHTLKKAKPTRARRNTSVTDNSRRSVMAEARKTAGGRGNEPIHTRKHPEPITQSDEGSDIDRRVGRSRANVEHLHGERIAEHGHTARRNMMLNTRKATAMLEDSAKDRPSRKSTRRSANHAKPNQLTRRTQRALRRPEARAERARAAEI